jgi:4-amino-4-deoxy-L-arabinose transferase-like glycosyltransferase
MTLQDIVHFVEVGAGKRFFRYLLPCLVILGIAILYNFRAWTNFSTPEAMDSAQLARNIATGKGYTTLFVRPLSIYLLQQKNQGKATASFGNTATDYADVKTLHPDLANAPVYPLVLAGLMKILKFHFAVDLNSAFWAQNGYYWRYQPDFLIGIFNQLLFLAVAIIVYFIANKLFDPAVAWLSAILVLGCELLWRFSASGLSTMLLLLIFLALVWCVLKIEEIAREPQPDTNVILGWSAAAGIVIGLGALTRYSFGWTILPVMIFVVLFSGPKRFFNLAAVFLAFVIVFAPWVARNISVSGTPFGTAGYAIMDGTPLAGGAALERSIHPNLTEAFLPSYYWHKFIANLVPILDTDLFKLGGSWLSVLFFAGLLLGFNRPGARRMRYFLLMCLALFIVVQALGRTSLSDESPEINSENQLVLIVPLVFIFGAAFFFILLDQMSFPLKELRYVVIGILLVLCCLPLFFAIWFKRSPVPYPPYYPPDIEKVTAWMQPNEMMMSDLPWAVAWYGNHQCVWLTQNDQDDFYAINDYIKPVSGLYLTMKTMDAQLVTDCFRSAPNSWGRFVLEATARNDIPKGFPLRHSPIGSAQILSGLFLTDADRWKIGKNASQ